MKRMKRLDTPFIRLLKYMTAVLLAAVVVFVGSSFFFRTQNRPHVKEQHEGFDRNRVEEKEKIRHMEEEQGRSVLEFEAERHYRAPDGYYHLEGSVKAAFLQPGQKEDIFFYGDEIIHDEEGEWFQVSGKARIESADITVNAASLKYDSKEGVVTGENGIVFQSTRLKGKAEQAQWKVRRNELILEKRVRLEMAPENEESPPIIVECGEVEYLKKWGHGFLRNDVDVNIGENHARADALEFRLTADREYLRSVKMLGRVEIDLAVSKGSGNSPPAESFDVLDGLLQKGEKSFVSEEIFIVFFHDMVKIQEFRSIRECEVNSVSDTGDSMRLAAQELRFRLNPNGGLKEFSARGNVRMQENKVNEDSLQIEAGALRIKDRKNVLEILKGKRGAAKVMSPDFEIMGGDINYFLNNRNLEVKKGVDVILEPSGNSSQAFFSSFETLFIQSEEMRFMSSSRRFFFKGETKFWQKKERLESMSLILDKENGKVMAGGGVQSVFHYQPEGRGDEKRIEITSGEFDYRPYQNEILFRERCFLRLEKANLKADEITLLLSEERKIKGLNARNSVTIKQESYEAQGEQAFFSAVRNEIILTGNPVLMDKDRGRTEGDKLTFSLADDRIIVENQGRERSLTVIK